MSNIKKLVGWSYPSSPNARRFGFTHTGCWTVEINASKMLPVHLAGFESPEEALILAMMIEAEWSELFYRYMPEVFRALVFGAESEVGP